MTVSVSAPEARDDAVGERQERLDSLLARVRGDLLHASLYEDGKRVVNVLRIARLNQGPVPRAHQRPGEHPGKLRSSGNIPLELTDLREAERRVHVREEHIGSTRLHTTPERRPLALARRQHECAAAGGHQVVGLHGNQHVPAVRADPPLGSVGADPTGDILDDRQTELRQPVEVGHEAESALDENRTRPLR